MNNHIKWCRQCNSYCTKNCSDKCPPKPDTKVIPAYGSLYQNVPQEFSNEIKVVDFQVAGPTLNVVASVENNTITIEKSGVYEISISLGIDINLFENAVGTLFLNNVAVDISTVSISTNSVTGPEKFSITTIAKTIQLDLLANDVLDVRVLLPGLIPHIATVSNSAFTVNKIG